MAEALKLTVDVPGRALGSATAAEKTETRTLVVENMHCGGCMRKVEQALMGVPDVVSARANLSGKRVVITTRRHAAATDLLTDALKRAGFPAAELFDSGQGKEPPLERAYLAYLGVAGFAAANVMLLSVAVWSGLASDMGPAVKTLFHWLSALIALPAIAYAGQPFFRSAAQALRARRLNMDVPISLGVTLAASMSIYQTVRGSEQVYFDAALSLLFFLLIGRALDQSMRARAFGAAANLLGLRSITASVIAADGHVERFPAHTLAPGQRILVASGERIAADGIVRRGESVIDDSLITGETRLKPLGAGSTVHAGTINMEQAIEIEATATNDGTLLAEIGRLMIVAEQGRGRYVRLADRAARLYAPAVHILGLATFLGWLALGHGWEAALTAAIAVLIITCPCALALAVPAVQVAASSRLFSQGIILKAADGLERLAEIDTVVFDKTGTLTLGGPHLVELSENSAACLANAAALAMSSRHPYARAIVRAAEERGIALSASAGVVEITGAGLARVTSVGEERLGSATWCGAGEQAAVASLWYRYPGQAPVPFQFEDRLRPDVADVVRRLTKNGLTVELLSGDRAEVVAIAAQAAGIERWSAAQTPADKIRRLNELKQLGRKVLMVGDGLNDAPALAAAHASLSPATAADITQTTADAVFQGERLAPVLELIEVARLARRMSLQNFAIALAYNAAFVPLAVTGQVTPLLAAIAMSASSLAVTINAVRLKSRTFVSKPLGTRK